MTAPNLVNDWLNMNAGGHRMRCFVVHVSAKPFHMLLGGTKHFASTPFETRAQAEDYVYAVRAAQEDKIESILIDETTAPATNVIRAVETGHDRPGEDRAATGASTETD